MTAIVGPLRAVATWPPTTPSSLTSFSMTSEV
jgi:hypothetical protein